MYLFLGVGIGVWGCLVWVGYLCVVRLWGEGDVVSDWGFVFCD